MVHPQPIVHSMVQFKDGSVRAQLGLPDMKLPILYAFTYPYRFATDYKRVDFPLIGQLEFERPDQEKFRNLALAYEAMEKGGNMPCILNAANEIAVASFLQDKISFLGMSDMIAYTMSHTNFILQPDYEDYVQTDAQARRIASEYLKTI